MKNAKGKTVQKANLPQKICLTCGRPFGWRKKWAKVWDEVQYCSDACRNHRAKPLEPFIIEVVAAFGCADGFTHGTGKCLQFVAINNLDIV